MRLEDSLPGAGRGARFREMQFTGDGLVLGEGTVLAKMNDEGLCVDEERVLTCLAVAFGPKVPPAGDPAPFIGRRSAGRPATRRWPPFIWRKSACAKSTARTRIACASRRG